MRKWLPCLALVVAGAAPARADDEAERVRSLTRRARALVQQGDPAAKDAVAAFEGLFAAVGGAEKAPAADRLGAGISAVRVKSLDAAEALLAGVERDAPASPEVRDRARYVRAVVMKRQGKTALALGAFERLAKDRADWSPVHYMIAVLSKQAQDAASDPAERDAHAARGLAALEALHASGPEQAGMYYEAALYRLGQLLLRQGERERGAQMMREFAARRRERGGEPITPEAFEEGTLFGLPEEPAPRPADPDVPRREGEDGLAEVALGDAARDADAPEAPPEGARPVLAAADLTGDGAVEIVHAAAGGRLRVLRRTDAGALEEIARADIAPVALAKGDLDNDGRTDLVAATADGALHLLRNAETTSDGALRLEPGRFLKVTRRLETVTGLGPVAGGVAALHLLDHDHDGDLDVLAVARGDGGLRLFRNAADGAFADVTAEAGLAGLGAVGALAPWDPDDDVDADLYVVAPGGGAPRLLANRRFGKFAPPEPVGADAGADDFPYPFGSAPPLAGAGDADVLADLDGDGRPERIAVAGPAGETGPVVAVAADLDGDRRLDLLAARGRALRALRNEAGAPMLRVSLLGTRSNRSAVGSVVEVLAGAHYARRAVTDESAGLPVLVGLGGNERAELVRVRWPNGAYHTIQPVLDVDPEQARAAIKGTAKGEPPARTLLVEEPKPIGSCPFLYAWDGERMRFVTDINGAGGIGLPTPEGSFFPFDEDEQLVLPWLAPDQDGLYPIAVTEELLETTYVDRVALLAVDAPAGAEVVPDERFAFSPAPKGYRLWCLPDLRPPARATVEVLATGRRTDITEAIAELDRRYGLGFEARGGQFLGLAEPHAVEIDLGALPAPGGAGPARTLLVLTGFLVWSEPQTNVAAHQTADRALHPAPLAVEVAAAGGGWRRVLDDAGYPSGRQKAVVIDLTAKVDPARPRVRLLTNRAIYWDRIAVSTAPADAPVIARPTELVSARSFHNGIARYSYPSPDGTSYEDHIFEEPLPHPPFPHAPGPHTRHGDVRPLVARTDDRLVVLSGGDALLMRFDARALPPVPEGWRRRWLVRFTGYCKGADLNAAPTAETTPLPFRSMSAYPFRDPGERPPDADAHARYVREWLTRWPVRRVEDLRARAAARR